MSAPPPPMPGVMVNAAIKRAHEAINEALMFAPSHSDTAVTLRDASLSLTVAAIANLEGR